MPSACWMPGVLCDASNAAVGPRLPLHHSPQRWPSAALSARPRGARGRNCACSWTRDCVLRTWGPEGVLAAHHSHGMAWSKSLFAPPPSHFIFSDCEFCGLRSSSSDLAIKPIVSTWSRSYIHVTSTAPLEGFASNFSFVGQGWERTPSKGHTYS